MLRHHAVAAWLWMSLGAIAGGPEQGSVARPAPPFPRVETAAISGVVVDADTGQSLPNVTVYLYGPRGQTGQVTDAKGRFLFERLAPYDQYRLSAVRSGYFDIMLGGASSGAASRVPPIAIAAGQWAKDVRVAMQRSASISGVVLDERGAPLVDAYVRVLTEALVAGHRQFLVGPVTRTDDRGAYRLAPLPAGAYYVQMPSVQESIPTASTSAELFGVSHGAQAQTETPGRLDWAQTVDEDALNEVVVGRYPIPPRSADGRWLVYPMTFFPSAASPVDAVKVSLTPGENRSGVDLRIVPVPGIRVSGEVVGPRESYAGLTVRLMALGTEELGVGGEIATALVGRGGRFTFERVPVGRYVVEARNAVTAYVTSSAVSDLPPHPGPRGMQGMAASSGPAGMFVRTATESAGGYWGREMVQVSDRGDPMNVVIAMHRGMSVSGHFVWEGHRPSLPDALSMIRAEPAHGEASLGVIGSRNDASSADHFTIDGLLGGEYVLAASSALASFSGVSIKSVICDGRDYTYKAIDASNGGALDDCVVTFTDRAIVLQGHAREDSGQTPTHTSVAAFPVERNQWTAIGLTPARFKATPVSTDGRYRLEGLAAGDYCVLAIPDDRLNGWMDPAFLQQAAPHAAVVHLDWGKVVTADVAITPWSVK